MSYPVMPLGFLGSQGDQDTYRIERSLRFNSADSAYFNRTPASAGNRKTWTFSAWIKLGNTNPTIATPLGTILSGSNGGPSLINSSGLRFCHANDPVGTDNVRMTSAIVRDPSAWYHVVWWCDTTQAGTRWKIYINGVEQTLETPAGYNGEPAQNTDLSINAASQHLIGQYAGSYFDGYLTEVYLIDGQALTPSSFGETDPITGRWKAKAYSGTYGTNGFYLNFADNSGTTATTLGKDSSGNGNNWTPNNFSVTAGAGNDSLVDSPTNYGTDTGVGGEVRGNYCTLNPLQKDSNITITNGNLDATSSGNYGIVGATVGVSSGKWYWEITATGATLAAGIFNQGVDISSYLGSNANGWAFETYGATAAKRNNNSASSYGSTLSANDIVGVKFDADNGTLEFLKNNVSLGTAYSGLTSGPYFPAIADPTTTANINCSVNFGQRPFAYTAPSGFKALCTTNLPTPTIQKPSSYMDVVTYTGNGSARSITGLGFSPDLVWIKGRSFSVDNCLFDSVRGATTMLIPNSTGAEGSFGNTTQTLTAFNSDGFSLGTNGNVNTNSATYVAWAWDEAPIAGMDIVGYTGNGTNRTIAHNLGVAPKMMIVKLRSLAGQEWAVYHASLANTQFLWLNSSNGVATGSGYWNSTSPTSSVFSIGSGNAVNLNNETYIAYLFAEVEGFSKFGSYTGNGSADGPFVFTGHRPRWVMIKRTDVANDWQIWDTQRNTFNTSTQTLAANLSDVEYTRTTTDIVDFNSNGFKVRASNAAVNASGGTYIFCAFAESAFKYSRAR